MSDSGRIGAAIRAAAEEVRAPASLRERVAGEARRTARVARRAMAIAAAAATLAVSAALALTTALRADSPELADAAALALSAPDRPAPRTDPADPRYLRAEIGGVRFPDYRYATPWRAAGARRAEIGGRDALTVTYALRGERIGYTIVAGEPLEVPASARRLNRDGVRMAAYHQDGARVVAWRQDGRTCVLASRTASLDRLTAWAAWV